MRAGQPSRGSVCARSRNQGSGMAEELLLLLLLPLLNDEEEDEEEVGEGNEEDAVGTALEG